MWWSQPGCRGWRLSRPLAFTLRCERVQPQAACDEPGCGVSASDNIIAETASHCICVCTYMASAVCVYGPRWCAYMASAVCIHTWRRWCAAPQGECMHQQLPQHAGQVPAGPPGEQHSRQLRTRPPGPVPGVQAHAPVQGHPARRGGAGAAGVRQPAGSGLRGDAPCAEVRGSCQQDQGRPATSGQVCERPMWSTCFGSGSRI